MKSTIYIFGAVGWVTLLGSVAGAIAVLLSHDDTATAMYWMLGPLALMGVIFVAVSLWMAKALPGRDIPNAVPATAKIMSVQDSGVTINDAILVVNLDLLVNVEGAPAYTATAKATLSGRNQWGALQPGMTIPVRVDPKDPQNVAVDLEGEASPNLANAPAGAIAQAINAVYSAGGAAAAAQAGMVTMKAADIIREGVKTDGKLVSVTPTGLTAAQAAGGLAPDEADDPLVLVEFSFAGDGGARQSCKCVVRVPDGKAAFLAAGADIPVAYLAGQPQTATIDWPRLV